MDGETSWLAYTSKQVYAYAAGRDELLQPYAYFPTAPAWPLPPNACRALPGDVRCDVWSAQVQLPVKGWLDAHAKLGAWRSSGVF